MSMFLFIIFAIYEIALTVLTFTKCKDKIDRLHSKFVFRAGESIVMLLVILLPGVTRKLRFLGCFVVILLRFAISGIVYLVKRKKPAELKKRAGAVVNCILSIILIFTSLIPAFVISDYAGIPITGKFDVLTASAILVDSSRVDTFETDGSFREVPAHFFYPGTTEGSYPLVIFSHGAFGYYSSNFSTYETLASNGYVVIALDHPHHAFFTKDTDGNTVITDMDFIKGAVDATNGVISGNEEFKMTHEWLKLRTDDENFVLNTVKSAVEAKSLNDTWHTDDSSEILKALSLTNIDKIGLMGHSLGGATSVAIGRQRDDIDAVVCIDGTMFSEIIDYKDGKNVFNYEPYPVPLLDFSNEAEYNRLVEQYNADSDYHYVNEIVVKNAVDGKFAWFKDTEHMDFTDLPLFSPFLASMLGKGSVNSEEFLPMMNEIILSWFNYYLKGEGTLNIKSNY